MRGVLQGEGGKRERGREAQEGESGRSEICGVVEGGGVERQKKQERRWALKKVVRGEKKKVLRPGRYSWKKNHLTFFFLRPKKNSTRLKRVGKNKKKQMKG